jgi:MraZ protein
MKKKLEILRKQQDFFFLCRIILKVVKSGAKWGEGGEHKMFMGEYQHNIDEKGRIIIPAKFREALGDTFIVTRGLDQSLSVYPRSEWTIYEQKLKSLSMMKSEARAFTRFVFSGATECELDKQGRITIPRTLIEHARLDKDCVITGNSNLVEIWSKPVWEDYTQASAQSFSDIAEKLVDFNFGL